MMARPSLASASLTLHGGTTWRRLKLVNGSMPRFLDSATSSVIAGEVPPYGAIGSRVNQSKRKQRLAEHFGLTEVELARLHGPVGLKNGARTPPEIAISILAELTAVRYGYRIPEPIALAGMTRIEAGCST